MLVLCKVKRDGGTTVPFSIKGARDYREYVFRPNARGDHVAEVEELDAKTLLGEESGYEEYAPTVTAAPARATVPTSAAELAPEPTAFLDALDREAMEKVAAEHRVKLDERHTDTQVRYYLRGLIARKG